MEVLAGETQESELESYDAIQTEITISNGAEAAAAIDSGAVEDNLMAIPDEEDLETLGFADIADSQRKVNGVIKKPSSAWLLFQTEKRGESSESTFTMQDLAEQWRALEPEEKQRFETLAKIDKDRYLREMSEEHHVEVSATTVNLDKAGLHIPLARVRKIIKLDQEVKSIGKEALTIITKATELFVGYVARRSGDIVTKRGAKTIKDADLFTVIHSYPLLDFLKLDFPRRPVEKSASKPRNQASTATGAAGPGAGTASSGLEASNSIKNFFSSKNSFVGGGNISSSSASSILTANGPEDTLKDPGGSDNEALTQSLSGDQNINDSDVSQAPRGMVSTTNSEKDSQSNFCNIALVASRMVDTSVASEISVEAVAMDVSDQAMHASDAVVAATTSS